MRVYVEPGLDHHWLHDDQEEDLVGADWHQDAIRALVISLRHLSLTRGWTWHVGDQLTLVGWKPNGDPWRPCPDISVFPTLGSETRQDVDLKEHGVPALIVEVASATTWEYDVSLQGTGRQRGQAGKVFGYLLGLGVPEYLVFDPHQEFIATACRAWRRVGEMVQE